VKLLTWAAKQEWYSQWRDSLPLAGIDGSLRTRLKGTTAEGRVWAKTGSLSDVHTLSGYARTVKGDELVFSIMANNHNLGERRARDVIDRIVNLVVDDSKRENKKK
jgi:D-alanyl-D-alanine carboxypeptidase/D-alanyl-D-alanine-endopeptidase (penicillin-binding protein 4)